jgi:hypothetical protein
MSGAFWARPPSDKSGHASAGRLRLRLRAGRGQSRSSGAAPDSPDQRHRVVAEGIVGQPVASCEGDRGAARADSGFGRPRSPSAAVVCRVLWGRDRERLRTLLVCIQTLGIPRPGSARLGRARPSLWLCSAHPHRGGSVGRSSCCRTIPTSSSATRRSSYQARTRSRLRRRCSS